MCGKRRGRRRRVGLTCSLAARLVQHRIKQPKLVVSKFLNQRHNVAGKVPDSSKYRTLADCAVVDDPNAWNALVDNCGIERRVVAEDLRSGERALGIADNRATRMPHGVKDMITPDGACAVR